ncbi:hypothetical protein [Laspinema olomoucense]|uniref:hypothetical protein n=1 Tax=Laspinema olomoucense TaxID=3231600 RepID=UPI0021BB214B|nr:MULTISPECIES: hypothetical protein [unclassified Laspinema]MCT7972292.1 hypothetical protein [Laspinema sp. D3d]MCT7996413.1 hypothetical protein [Laspinema sp. D3c]
MLRAVQQTVKVGTGGKIELIAPECPEGAEVQVIVLLSNSNQGLKFTMSPEIQALSTEIESKTTASFQSSLTKIQNKVRQYVPEGESLVDELITERRAEANRE